MRGLGTKEFNKLVEERLLIEIMPSVLALLTETQSCCQLGFCRVAHFLGYSQHLSRGQDVARTYPTPRVHAAISFCFTAVKLLVDLSRFFFSVSGASGRNTGGLMPGSLADFRSRGPGLCHLGRLGPGNRDPRPLEGQGFWVRRMCTALIFVAGAIFCHTRLAKCLGPGFCWRGLFRRACSTPSVASVSSGGRADHRAFPCDLPIRHSSRSLRSRETRRRLQRTCLLFCVLLKARRRMA